MTPNLYTGSTVTFTLTKITVIPSICENTVTYAITSIIAPIVPPSTSGSNFTTKLGTSTSFVAIPFDGIFNGQATDGTYGAKASSISYSTK